MATLHLLARDSVAGTLIDASAGAWEDYTRHAFVEQLGRGELPEPAFRFYLVQDYLFLVQFARAWALAAFKSEEIVEVRECAALVHALIDEEMRLHVEYCARFELDEAAMAATPEHPANIAYTRYVVERGVAGDLLDLLVVLAPCVLGYGEIGVRLASDPHRVIDANPYRAWIASYSGDEYREVVHRCSAQLDRVAAARLGSLPEASPRWPQLVRQFERACLLEVDFWQMGLRAGG